MNAEQEDGARRASADWERLWRIFSNVDQATPEEIAWAEEFFKHNNQNCRMLIDLEPDPKQREILELVYLGLYHRGYTLPPEFKFMKAFLN